MLMPRAAITVILFILPSSNVKRADARLHCRTIHIVPEEERTMVLATIVSPLSQSTWSMSGDGNVGKSSQRVVREGSTTKTQNQGPERRLLAPPPSQRTRQKSIDSLSHCQMSAISTRPGFISSKICVKHVEISRDEV
jgi:hypothetical protein